jgi:hypothetical protein
MDGRRQFLLRLAELNPSRVDQAIALLWYYEQTQLYSERSAPDLVCDIEEEGFGRQAITRLQKTLRKSRFTVGGSVKGTFRVNAARFQELSDEYLRLLDIVESQITSSIIPFEFVAGTRTYLERLVKQINGSYDVGYFDASAVMLRRLMESLLIEVYISRNRQADIKVGGAFMQLNGLIKYILSDLQIDKSRGFAQGMNLVKDVGDTAAHDRAYITPKQDIDDNKTAIRRVINELLVLAGIR